ncbi:TIGR02217 family protein [Hirschia litorea]|uniref:TIGR02217 family protein n=1 Tax=Hirschia litorea TaxID=1199156 RepID=A0ABW2IIV0_9PROT
MSGFHDVSLPMAFALGAAGGPQWRTQVTQLASGREFRNGMWAGSRRRWDVGGGVQSLADLEQLTAFFEARHGRLYSFRFRDVTDWKSCPLMQEVSALDQALGVGDGVQTVFPLVKRYESGGQTVLRSISKPVDGRVVVNAGDTNLIEGWRFNAALKAIEFDEAPAQGDVVSAGFEFDLHARFDTDTLAVSLDHLNAGRVVSAPIIELID